ncbi:serine hydrolase domain-containing protein [Streptococcus halichoeri]|uniref:serine hydrolase domain-containing protein n=1 Tax=Streptococcus halichoeri TaxID=254785 RepID=UPI002E2D2F7A|nr:serine hydrolase domain-containing protein [Streptococcus halichoeri]
MMNQEKLAKLFTTFVQKHHLPQAIVALETTDKKDKVQLSWGQLQADSPFLMASVTKLWVTTLILQLIDQKKVFYDSIVTDFIPKEKLAGIHSMLPKNQDLPITVADLLFQRTGFGNIFYEEPIRLKERIAREDFAYSWQEMKEWVQVTPAHFLPGSKAAYYADINFTLLGLIIEHICHQDLDVCVEKAIMLPLGLQHSYLCSSEYAVIPPLYTGRAYLDRPKVVASGQGAGGGVSTCQDLLVFIRAFFEGQLFNKDHWNRLKDYYPLQADYAPVLYGGGHMLLAMGKPGNHKRPEFYGHSGISGAFAFFCPQLNLYLSGTTDHAGQSSLCIQLIYLLLSEIERERDQTKSNKR